MHQAEEERGKNMQAKNDKKRKETARSRQKTKIVLRARCMGSFISGMWQNKVRLFNLVNRKVYTS